MRVFTICSIALLSLVKAYSQHQLQLIGACGGHMISDKLRVDFAIGETAVHFYNLRGNAGFIQPAAIPLVNITNVSATELPAIRVFEFLSPNNDGKNDLFYIDGLAQFFKNELTVFNKEGQIVFEQKNYDNTWAGDQLPSDNYFYIFRTYQPEQEFKGGLVLTR